MCTVSFIHERAIYASKIVDYYTAAAVVVDVVILSEGNIWIDYLFVPFPCHVSLLVYYNTKEKRQYFCTKMVPGSKEMSGPKTDSRFFGF